MQRLYDYMVEQARYRDRLYFCADQTAATALGVSRRTILRWRCQLEQIGRIQRCGRHRFGPLCSTVVYAFPGRRVTQRLSGRRPRTSRTTPRLCEHSNRNCGSGRRRAGRRRRLMLKPASTGLVVRRAGPPTPFNASDAVAAVCDLYGHPIPGQLRARLGRSAKNLLADGFPPNTVCAALYAAVRRARVDLADQFALEIQNAQTGLSLSWLEWRQALHSLQPLDEDTAMIFATLRGDQ